MYLQKELFQEEKLEWGRCLKEAKQIVGYNSSIYMKFEVNPWPSSKNPISTYKFTNGTILGLNSIIYIAPEVCSIRTTKDFKVSVLSHELIEDSRGIFKIIFYKILSRFRSYSSEQNVNKKVYEKLSLKFGHIEAKRMMSEIVRGLIEIAKMYGEIDTDSYQQAYDWYVKNFMPFLVERES
jgi:hypothetical protein